MDVGETRRLIADHNKAYSEALRLDRQKNREAFINKMHSIIGETWKSLPKPLRALVYSYQQFVGRSDQNIRKLFALSIDELEKLHSINTLHLLTNSITSCRNVSENEIKSMLLPMYITLEKDATVCFDVGDFKHIHWISDPDGRPHVQACVPFDVGSGHFEFFELDLTDEESELCCQMHRETFFGCSIEPDQHKRSQDDSEFVNPKRLKTAEYIDDAMELSSQPGDLGPEEEYESLMMEQFREWEMQLD